MASHIPDAVSEVVQPRDGHYHENLSNLTLAKTEADAAEQAIGASVKLIEKAIALGTRTANLLEDSAGRLRAAQEIQALQDRIVGYSRTVVRGRYIFSGDEDLTPPYMLDLTAAHGVVQLHSAPATIRIEDAAGGSFAFSKHAEEIFDSRDSDGSTALTNIFAALNSLRLALINCDSAAIAHAIARLRAASSHLSSIELFYSAVQNRLENAIDSLRFPTSA